jgi:predicted aspartyl protease
MRKSRHVLSLLVLCCACAHAYAGTQPLQRTKAGHLATEVTLQGHAPVLFNVDTGAGSSALYEHMRKRLGLVPEAGQQVWMQGAAGAQTVERYRLPTLSLAGMETRDLLVPGLPAGVSHGADIMGIVGRDVLARHVVEFDLVSDRLGLHAPGTALDSANGWESVPFRVRPELGLVELTVTVGGARVDAVLDTGARKSFVNSRVAHAAGVDPTVPGRARGSTASGATPHAFDFEVADFAEASIGQLRFGPRSLSIADLPVFGALGLANRPAMILGLDLLGDRRFVLDYPAGRLLIER